MALEHALLVALSERPASGLELTKRFETSLGFFWHATHQQIYRVLARMEADGWVTVEVVEQDGRPDKRVHTPSDTGRKVLAEWLATPTPMETFRSELAVKMRGASYGERAALLRNLREVRADHALRLATYERMEREQFPEPAGLEPRLRDRWLVLRGGIRLERFWIDWIDEYLQAHEPHTMETS
ncbi:PadR family transcriptional regulator [Nocardioides flavus (ex Wang et al. 2016)]|uniref:PadR family transcriptional regulator n=1 Tax=Nocardioides flavus (ex Wang et al. 2016) TaxID=2058780 RepID=A0ABQ3HDV0_9ACTN|nr:PadR family transcriptional regulator [Nocardioides flavus (ex Wang et al. 2016)]GHE15463.1 PadR family transcriptional regulator [Nocardioides flavus (ex Wang et al. 2016)]